MLPQHRALPLDSSPNQFSLYTSPSLPNISLGLQATVTVTNSHLTVSTGHAHCPRRGLCLSQSPEGAERAWPDLAAGQRVREGCRSESARRAVPACALSAISLQPHQASPKLSTQQEAERQALQSLRQGGTLTGKFMSTSSIPGCLLGVALEGDTSPHGHASLLQHVLLLEQARQQSTLIAGEWMSGVPEEGCPAAEGTQVRALP